jgi:Ca2+-binding RTX toxin-like protein
LTLTGSAALNGTGNELNNVITGNAGANSLNGGNGNDTLVGGLGADTLTGGAGDDIYVIDSSDTLVEVAGGGNDTVQTSQSYTLLAEFEYLTLTGSLNVNGTGNAANNVLNGNAGNNTLDGGGGADNMFGGLGNDTYVVDNVLDRASENSALGGTDTVMSSVSFTLGANIENLTLTGSGNVNGIGNDLGNAINGNAGDNSISGGLGADTLSGGAGNDSFLYGAAAHSTAAARDTILSFASGDKINLAQIDANATTTGTNDAFTFIGSGAFTGTAGQLRAYKSGTEWIVEGDTNGDGTADLVIGLTTANPAIIAADFVL